jgi:hypothetical protein
MKEKLLSGFVELYVNIFLLCLNASTNNVKVLDVVEEYEKKPFLLVCQTICGVSVRCCI